MVLLVMPSGSDVATKARAAQYKQCALWKELARAATVNKSQAIETVRRERTSNQRKTPLCDIEHTEVLSVSIVQRRNLCIAGRNIHFCDAFSTPTSRGSKNELGLECKVESVLARFHVHFQFTLHIVASGNCWLGGFGLLRSSITLVL